MNSSFGAEFLDADNDGHRDLLVINGHIMDNIAIYHAGVTYAEVKKLYRNLGAGKFVDVSETQPQALSRAAGRPGPRRGRLRQRRVPGLPGQQQRRGRAAVQELRRAGQALAGSPAARRRELAATAPARSSGSRPARSCSTTRRWEVAASAPRKIPESGSASGPAGEGRHPGDPAGRAGSVKVLFDLPWSTDTSRGRKEGRHGVSLRPPSRC